MRRFSNGFVLGIVAATVVLTASAALAGTGVGAVFNLGRINSVDQGSTLSGAAPKLLIVKNTGSGPAAVGISIQVPPGKPPLQVNSAARIAHLNSDLLDGMDSHQFVHGNGSILQETEDLAYNTADILLDVPGFFQIQAGCPVNQPDAGAFLVVNKSGAAFDAFIDHEGAAPDYTVIPDDGWELRSDTGSNEDAVHVQVASPSKGVADINLFIVHRGSDCHYQVLATIAGP
jgi:hypothetical protein